MVKTAKHIRLAEIAKDETLDKLLDAYKEAKKSHDISKILGFKSFVTRMVEAQNERILYADGEYHKQWTTVDDFTLNVLCKKNNWPKLVRSALDYIIFMVNINNMGTGPFGYNRKEHLNRTL
jgi:hypothetical protein